MEIITSLENSKVKYWTKLNQKKFRDNENMFLIEGEHLVLEAQKTKQVREVIALDNMAILCDAPVHYVTKSVMEKISVMPSAPRLIAVCQKLEEKEYGDKLLLLDAIQDPGNLGTIIRSALAFGIDTIVLGDDTVDLYNDKTIRASEGMLFHINIIKRNLSQFISEISVNNYQIMGTSVDGGTKLSQINLSSKFAFIVGNEGSGVSENLLEMCSDNIYIPIPSVCESLNVAVATSIILYELRNKYEN